MKKETQENRFKVGDCIKGIFNEFKFSNNSHEESYAIIQHIYKNEKIYKIALLNEDKIVNVRIEDIKEIRTEDRILFQLGFEIDPNVEPRAEVSIFTLNSLKILHNCYGYFLLSENFDRQNYYKIAN